MFGQTGITFSNTLWIKLHFFTTIFVLGFDMWYKSEAAQPAWGVTVDQSQKVFNAGHICDQIVQGL